jgi:hypothetical protein
MRPGCSRISGACISEDNADWRGSSGAQGRPSSFLHDTAVITGDFARSPRWTLTPGADLMIRAWDADCVVHHALSNDTHRIAAWLVPALERLARPAPAGLAELCALLEADEDTVAMALQELERLLLVERC